MSFIQGMTVVYSMVFAMSVVGVYELEIAKIWAWLKSPMMRVTVEWQPEIKINDDDSDDWDVVSEDSDPVLWTGAVVPACEYAEIEITWMGDEMGFVDSEVIHYGPPIKNRRFQTYMADCDWTPSPSIGVVWTESIKAATYRDAHGEMQFAWL